MGQYFYVVNIDKQQYLHPHHFGDGLKFLEIVFGQKTLAGLALLLSNGNGRGGGDARSSHPLVGSWAGDRIVIAGDYGDPGKFGVEAKDENGKPITLFRHASQHFEDVSEAVIAAMREDGDLKDELLADATRWDGGGPV
jgi:hypothetical protein